MKRYILTGVVAELINYSVWFSNHQNHTQPNGAR